MKGLGFTLAVFCSQPAGCGHTLLTKTDADEAEQRTKQQCDTGPWFLFHYYEEQKTQAIDHVCHRQEQ